MIRSRCPEESYPTASITIGVTAMIVMMTIDAKTSSTIVEKTNRFINRFDFRSSAQYLVIRSMPILISFNIIITIL